MSKPTSPTYKTTNWADYNAALKRRGSLTIWFDPEMNWDAEPSGKRGRSRTFSDAAIQTCLTMKVLFGMALRQTTGFVESLLRLTGLDWDVPDFSTISRRQRTLAVNIPYRGAAAVIPPRRNAQPWKPTTAGAIARNDALRASKYLGRALWRNWSGYHRRSRAETKMHCVKLLGQRLMARDFDRQVAEVQVRVAILNGYTALGIPVTKAVG